MAEAEHKRVSISRKSSHLWKLMVSRERQKKTSPSSRKGDGLGRGEAAGITPRTRQSGKSEV